MNQPSALPRTAVLGFPRIGRERELKRALEQYWAQTLTAEDLHAQARSVRAANYTAAFNADIDCIPVGDFALYDHVLDTACLLGVCAPRHNHEDELESYFAAARGRDGVKPLEMTKWFDTNYHYLVPELDAKQTFSLHAEKWLSQLQEFQSLSESSHAQPRAVVLGPFSFLLLAKGLDSPLKLLPDLTQVYAQFLQVLWAAGVREVQIDEPHLVCDHTQDELDAWALSMQSLCAASDLGICLSTYFGHLDALTLEYVRSLPLAELHVDLTQDTRAQLPAILAAISPTTRLSAGVVSGRNIWATDVERALTDLDLIAQTIGIERLSVATSCSLLHVPYALDGENKIPSEIREWLAFGREKLDEITLLQKALVLTAPDRDVLLEDARARQRQRRESTLINDASVRARISALSERSRSRALPLRERLALQHQRLQLPLLPTTTIGSFPQTSLIRLARARWRKHEIDDSAYETFIANEIESCIHLQERLGLDVLVHGESERNDMVEYFGERLQGFAFTANGWVQSYGSRCVKPPILYGAVSRPQPMTVRWWDYAQSLTSKSVKGMLTGPITILQWSWVRDDQPLETTATEIALAVSDEVEDLQAAGAAIIQVDEAALREGLPLRMSEHAPYLRWAIDSFRLAVARAQPQTQIHTHMCYSHFADMFKDIARLDADVLSIEASRSGMELLDIFRDFAYEGEIGPGVYDIHSPRVPTTQEIKALIALAAQRLRPQQMWVNPDCGLKTRTADEVKAALTNLVAAAAASRRELSV